MKLSVIIVNYNVRYFLEQCLHSVIKAASNLPAEIFVVDNHSVDGSVSMIREKFPDVNLIANTNNTGFSKANNQAIKKAKGEFILLLNPDTIVEEHTFTRVIGFMEKHPEAGGLGVKMIDGKGNFLPESKRGFPSPWVAFYKIFGLAGLFPGSERFGKYHLSYLNKNEIHEVDVLAGAFMLLRAEALKKTGLLDEDFFMYGEDIDLSYRIITSGYKNIYFPETTIIHYKGESTIKSSINYVRMFYNAMIIFARKHFSEGNARWFSLLIHIAIWFRAFLSVTSRLFSKTYLPLLDAGVMFSGYVLLIPLWEKIRLENDHYPPLFIGLVVPAYILFWIAGIGTSGGYRQPVNLYKVVRGLFWGTIAILLAYSLASEGYRFSRVLILLGSAWAMLSLVFVRIIFNRLKIRGFELNIGTRKRTAIVGHKKEAERIKGLLNQSSPGSEVLGFISVSNSGYDPFYIGHAGELEEIIRINRINELIFCGGNMESGEIIQSMIKLSGTDVDFKIAPPESFSIIGSNSIHTAGDLYVVNVNAISKPANKKIKRISDITISLVLIILSPVLIWFYPWKLNYINNLFRALSGKISFVGYIPGNRAPDALPVLKQGVLNPGDLFQDIMLTPDRKSQLNILYAKDYQFFNDLEIILKNWRKLDRFCDE